MPKHRITRGLQSVIVLDEGYHKFCVSSTGCHIASVAQDATVYILVTLKGGNRVVSGVVRVTTSGVVSSRATQVAYGQYKYNGVLTHGVLLIV